MRMRERLVTWAAAIVLFAMVVLLETVCSPCPAGMICVKTTAYIQMAAVTAACLTMAGGLDVTTPIHPFLLWAGFILSLTIPFLAKLMGGCQKLDMRCHTHTFPTVYLCCILVYILYLILCVMRKKAKKVDQTGTEEY